MLDFLFNKVAALQVTKKRLQHGWFPDLKWLLFENNKSDYLGIIFIDLSKAYDYLPHGLLLSHIEAYLVNEKGLYLILNYVTNYR